MFVVRHERAKDQKDVADYLLSFADGFLNYSWNKGEYSVVIRS